LADLNKILIFVKQTPKNNKKNGKPTKQPEPNKRSSSPSTTSSSRSNDRLLTRCLDDSVGNKKPPSQSRQGGFYKEGQKT
jgi:hypothetical protein